MTHSHDAAIRDAIADMPAINHHEHARACFSESLWVEYDLPRFLGTGYLNCDLASAGYALPGGAFAFNIFMPFNRQKGLVRTETGYEWPPTTSYHNGSPRTYDPVSQIETLVESNAHAIELRHTTLAEFSLLFEMTGFEIAEMFGDTDRRPFTGAPTDDYTMVARRK